VAQLISTDGTRFELVEGENLIGRGPREDNDPPKINLGLLQGYRTVSRRHARIREEGGKWYIRVEPEAPNPTLVGGRRVFGGEEALLVGNTSVQLGDVTLVFRGPVPASQPDVTIVESEPGPDTTRFVPEPLPHVEAPEVTPAREEPAEESPVPPAKPRPRSAPSVSWPARLTARPDAINGIGVSEFKRVNPFKGLMIDEVAGGETGRFAASVAALASALGRELRPVTRWHPLLMARHPFAMAPLKADPTNGEGVTLAEGDGLILTTADYGCTWTGGHGDDALPRDTVRAALQLGVNAAVFARQRQRPLEAIELEF